MKHTIFTGCSFTKGGGFDLEDEEPGLWVNQLYHEFFSHTTKINIAVNGRSNAGIFQDTVKALMSYPVAYAIVEWTSTPRYELDLGFELYSTRQVFSPGGIRKNINTNNINYSKKYLTEIQDRFVTLVHPCYEILNLVGYINSLSKLASLTGTNIFFINGLCTWDNDFFSQKINVLPNQYTEFTQSILNVKTRVDTEIFQLYNKLHEDINNAGGINESKWLNLYNSMRSNKIDVNADGIHPGIKSNNLYFNMFSKTLNEKLY